MARQVAKQHLADGNGWLSFEHSTPTLVITDEGDEFDLETLKAWRDEGFNVKYLPMGMGGKAYVSQLHSLGDGMSIGERYAIVAFGAAASICLEVYSEPSTRTSKLCSLVAYYPTSIPDPKRPFSASFRVLVHLALGIKEAESLTVGVSRRPEVLGIQGKRRRVKRQIPSGIGVGGLQSEIRYPVFTYECVDPGFAEHDLDQYDAIADALSWSRSLSTVRLGFGAQVDLESIWEQNVEQKLYEKNINKFLDTLVQDPIPYVNYTPTMTGGKGADELTRFYANFFLPCAPRSFQTRLISRTIGVDRIVDELYIHFKHTVEIPWMLPNIPPTNKHVEVVVVSIVGMRAGKVWQERVYWDQASVLFQIGLIDSEEVPEDLRDKGVEMLPIAGAEAASKILNFDDEATNDMIDDFEDEPTTDDFDDEQTNGDCDD